MYNIAFRIVKNTAEAEDVMQESFITAFSKLQTLKDGATFGSWLKRIVVNNSISQFHKSKRFVRLNDDVPIAIGIKEVVEEDLYSISSEDYTHLKENRVLKCMESLNSNYHQILNLHFIEGFDYEEICEILNISYANCRTMISRAKESLRKKLILTE